MYINFKYAGSKGLSPYDILTLQVIRQQRFENLEDVLAGLIDDEKLDTYKENGWVEEIKGKKDESELAKLRTTKTGNKLLDDIETADVTEDSVRIFDWLEQVYKSEGKMIGNKKRTKAGIAQFSANTGINKNCLATLLKEFVSDDENMIFNNKLENAFYSSKNLYSRKFNIDECRVYTYYEKRKERFDKIFAEILKKENNA